MEFEGYVPVNRKFFSHVFWREKRTFSKSEAWLDLIASARFDESQATELIGGKLVSWSRGQLPASLRYLSERWSWSKNKVSDFLDLLEKQAMITRYGNAGQTIVSLINYETFNKKGQRKGHKKGQSSDLKPDHYDNVGDSEKDNEKEDEGTARGQRGDKTNKVNKENKDNSSSSAVKRSEVSSKPLLDRKQEFYQKLVPHVQNYGKEMIRAFFDYWSEVTKSGSKMRFETEKTWEVDLRLKRWKQNEEKFQNKDKGPEKPKFYV
jgi:hypothetical protein